MQKKKESSMNWAMPPRIESRLGTATAVAALIAISAHIVPTQAFATPTQVNAPAYAIDATKLAFKTNDANIRTSPHDPTYARLPVSVSYHGGANDDDDDDDYMYY
jgi:hypothetical protein